MRPRRKRRRVSATDLRQGCGGSGVLGVVGQGGLERLAGTAHVTRATTLIAGGDVEGGEPVTQLGSVGSPTAGDRLVRLEGLGAVADGADAVTPPEGPVPSAVGALEALELPEQGGVTARARQRQGLRDVPLLVARQGPRGVGGRGGSRRGADRCGARSRARGGPLPRGAASGGLAGRR